MEPTPEQVGPPYTSSSVLLHMGAGIKQATPPAILIDCIFNQGMFTSWVGAGGVIHHHLAKLRH